jgi:hypothetical protein
MQLAVFNRNAPWFRSTRRYAWVDSAMRCLTADFAIWGPFGYKQLMTGLYQGIFKKNGAHTKIVCATRFQ